MLTWVDGELLDEAAATVSVFDRGLTVGDGVFESVKVVDGVPFALGRHLARLRRSAGGLGLAAPTDGSVRAACAAVIGQLNGTGEYRLRITYTAGTGPLGPTRGEAQPRLMVAVAALTPTPATTIVAVVPWVRNERSPLAGIKATSYVDNVLMLDRARTLGASEAIMADTRGRLCEGTGSNVFVVIDGEVLTPGAASGCLPGVTRELVLEWTDAREADLDYAVLDTADEIFLTSSTRDVQGVATVIGERRRRDLSAPGPRTAQIAAIFAERSRVDPEP